MVLRIKFIIVSAMTLARIALTFVAAHLLLIDSSEYALVAFAIAALFDFDGFFARWWGVTTGFGELLDPLADKLLVLTIVCALFIAHTHDLGWGHYLALAVPSCVIIVREGVMLMVTTNAFVQNVRGKGMRYLRGLFVFGIAHSGTRVSVSSLGKYKMGAQCVALVCLIGATFDGVSEDTVVHWFVAVLPWLGLLLYWFAGYLTLISGLEYLRAQYPRTAPRIDPFLYHLWVPAFMR